MKFFTPKQFKSIILTITAIVLFTTGWFLFSSQEAPVAEASWWNDSWLYRKAIVINADYVAGSTPHEDFPVMVNFTDSDVGTHAQEDGDDLIFIDAHGQKLSHEIESFATTTGALVAWVKLPSLDPGDDTIFYLYYGNASSQNQEKATDVWSSNFKGVWHLSEEPDNSAAIYDSTSFNTNGTMADSDGDSSATSSPAGNGIQFTGGSDADIITFGSPASLNISGELSFFMWAYFDQVSSADVIAGQSDSGTSNSQYVFLIGETASETSLYWGGQNYTDVSSASLSAMDGWHMVGFTRSGSSGNWTSNIYIDGQLDETVSSISTNPGSQAAFTIGTAGVLTSYYYDGALTEVFVMDDDLSAEWIETTYNNINSPATFFSIQSQEVGPGPVGYWGFDEGYGTTANDNSGQGYDGTVYGASWQNESMCLSGKCLYFDGSNDYVDFPLDAVLEAAGDNKLTYSLWVKPLDMSSTQVVMGANDNNGLGDDNNIMELYIDSGSVGMNVIDAFPLTKNLATSTDWQHWVAVFDNPNWYLYIDGVLAGQKNSNQDVSTLTPLSFRLGRPYADTRYFNGYIDEVKIYPYARSADEIKADYNAGLSGMQSNSGVAASFGGSSDKWMSDGLVGYWKFDEVSGATTVYDSSGNGSSCTATNNASTTVGRYGNSASVDAATDTYFDCNNQGVVDTDRLTISAWVYPEGLSEWQGVVTKDTLINYWFGFEGASGDFDFILSSNGQGSQALYCEATNIASNDNWYHMAGTYDGEYIRIYQDGELVQACAYSGGVYSSSADLWFGDSNRWGDNEFDGQIDEVRIYNRALSPDEVRKLYEWAPGPVAWWKFDEKSGTTAYDSAASTTMSGGNDGILGGNGIGTDVPAWTRGKYGSALQFDGDLDYIAVEKNEGLNFTDNDFTFSSWFYLEETPTAEWMYLYSSGRGDAGTDKWWMVFVDLDGELAAGFDDGSTNYFSTGAAIDLKTWYHVEAVFKQQDSIDIYLNGVYSHSRDLSAAGLGIENSEEDRIGRRSNDTSSWNGLLDDVKIYNYARTQKQILADMAGQGSDSSQGIRSLNQPVLRLSFDEGRGATAYDSSIHANNGTLYPGTGGANTASSAMWSLDGYSGGAMEFDGTDDYVDLGEPAVLDVVFDELTLSAWFKMDSSDDQDGIMGKYTAWYLAAISETSLRFRHVTVGDGTTVINVPNMIGSWHHVVATYDGANTKLYFDGEYKGGEAASGSIDTNNNHLAVGDIQAADWPFDGLIDEVQIWNYALSASEVKTVYNQGQAAVMGSVGHSTSNATSSNAQSLEYCIPGDTSPCGAPVLELKFDEKSGTTTYDTSGNGNDASSVTAAETPEWTRGKFGSAMLFDGSDDYLSAGSSDDIFYYGTPMTIEAWIYPESLGGNSLGRIVSRGNATNDDGNFQLSLSNRLRFEYRGGTTLVQESNNNAVTMDEWQHVAVTWDGSASASNVDFYVNGIETTYQTSTDCVTPTDTSSHITWIGDRWSGSRAFDGKIDELKIYNYVRTPAQIAWDYNRGGPIAHWSFDECEGSVIHDMSGSNHGTLNLGTTGTTATGTCAESGTSFWYNGRSGKINSAGSFDGLSDYIESDSSVSLADDGSISLWYKSSGAVLSAHTFFCDSADYGEFRLRRYLDDRQLLFNYNQQSVGFYPKTNVFDGNWHHIQVVWDASGNSSLLYIDGELESSDSSALSYMSSITSLRIARSSGSDYGRGLIDEVKVWNYALTPEQVKIEFNNGAVSFGQ